MSSLLKYFGGLLRGAPEKQNMVKEVPNFTNWGQMVAHREGKLYLDPANQAHTSNGISTVDYKVEDDEGYCPLIVLPNEVMEEIFSHCAITDILAMNTICRRWKTFLSNVSFWRLFFKRNNIDIGCIPRPVLEKENCWVALYVIAKEQLLTRNLVNNPSGAAQFQDWNLVENGGNGIIIENPPVGCGPLPDNGLLNDSHCFTTSFAWGTIRQTLTLSSIGLSAKVISILAPFKFVFTVMVGTRFDCAGTGICSLKVRNEEGQSWENTAELTSQAGANWKEIKLEVAITEDWLNYADLQDVVITLSGTERQFWAGNYGVKFARASLKIHFIHPDGDAIEPDNGAAAAATAPDGYTVNFRTIKGDEFM